GDTIEDAASATEVEDFFEGSTDLFDAIDEQDLATFVSSLSEAARGAGDEVAAAWESSADASTLGVDTLDLQLRALDSWSAFQDAIRSVREEFNANRADYERVLTTLRPFAEDLAALLAGTRPDIDTYLERGDSVVRMLTANEEHITELNNELGDYVQAFAGGLSDERLPDGSA